MNVISQTKKTMQKAIINFAKKHEVEPTQSQIVIYTEDEECSPKYRVLKHYKDFEPKKVVTFNEILGVKIDMLQREFLATPHIQACLKRLLKENECTHSELSIVICTNDNEANNVGLFLYLNGKPKQQISFEYIFGEQ